MRRSGGSDFPTAHLNLSSASSAPPRLDRIGKNRGDAKSAETCRGKKKQTTGRLVRRSGGSDFPGAHLNLSSVSSAPPRLDRIGKNRGDAENAETCSVPSAGRGASV